MDWEALCVALADRGREAAFGLDERRMIVATTPAMRELFDGRCLMGQPLASLLVEPAPRLTAFLSSTTPVAQSFSTTARLAQRLGAEPPVVLDIHPLHAEGRGYVGKLSTAIQAPALDGDVEYELTIRDGRLGELRRVNVVGGSIPRPLFFGRRCFEVICDRADSCSECPVTVLAGRSELHESTLVGFRAGAFELRTARRLSVDTVAVQSRRLLPEHVRDLQTARVAQLAQRANLSERERQVLEHLLLGAQLGHIAQALGITPRTAKFHQANLLAKLGADSRADLLRILA